MLAAAGVAVLAVGLPQAAWLDGHPAQLVIPLLWVVAGLDARDGRVMRAGVLVGLSGGLELWGVLGACALLLAPEMRGAARALGIAAAVFTVPLAPFVLFGDFRMFQYEWLVTAGRPPAGLIEPGSPFGWPLRVAQAAASVSAGAAVAYLLRRRPEAVWAVPLAGAGVRLFIGPLVYAAY